MKNLRHRLIERAFEDGARDAEQDAGVRNALRTDELCELTAFPPAAFGRIYFVKLFTWLSKQPEAQP